MIPPKERKAASEKLEGQDPLDGIPLDSLKDLLTSASEELEPHFSRPISTSGNSAEVMEWQDKSAAATFSGRENEQDSKQSSIEASGSQSLNKQHPIAATSKKESKEERHDESEHLARSPANKRSAGSARGLKHSMEFPSLAIYEEKEGAQRALLFLLTDIPGVLSLLFACELTMPHGRVNSFFRLPAYFCIVKLHVSSQTHCCAIEGMFCADLRGLLTGRLCLAETSLRGIQASV